MAKALRAQFLQACLSRSFNVLEEGVQNPLYEFEDRWKQATNSPHYLY